MHTTVPMSLKSRVIRASSQQHQITCLDEETVVVAADDVTSSNGAVQSDAGAPRGAVCLDAPRVRLRTAQSLRYQPDISMHRKAFQNHFLCGVCHVNELITSSAFQKSLSYEWLHICMMQADTAECFLCSSV